MTDRNDDQTGISRKNRNKRRIESIINILLVGKIKLQNSIKYKKFVGQYLVIFREKQ